MTALKDPKLSGETRDMTKLLKVLADENRLRIIDCLSSGEKCVCELTEAIDISQNLMSHHLKTLRDHGLVVDERRGRWVYYSLALEGLKELLDVVHKLCDCATPSRECQREC